MKKTKLEILKESMNVPYIGKQTRFDYLDDEEITLILDAMEKYLQQQLKK